jgi:hypothetical protein
VILYCLDLQSRIFLILSIFIIKILLKKKYKETDAVCSWSHWKTFNEYIRVILQILEL